MILDEKLTVEISPIKVSHGGNMVEVNELVFTHPTPSMAQATFKMRRHFTAIQKEGQKVLMAMDSDVLRSLVAEGREISDAKKLQAGSVVEPMSKEYAVDSPEAREKKLEEIKVMESGFMEMLDMCDLDYFKMTVDFGNMIVKTKRCKLSCGDIEVPLTDLIWTSDIDPLDRLKAAVKYCCFFGLTSNTRR